MERFPTGYGNLADQLRRASISVPLNIAEGSGKTGKADQRRYYSSARGSAMECGAIVDACLALGLIDESAFQNAIDMLESIVRMLSKMCVPHRVRR